MRNNMTAHERKNDELIMLFDEFLQKRPDVLDEIPDNAVLVMQLEIATEVALAQSYRAS